MRHARTAALAALLLTVGFVAGAVVTWSSSARRQAASAGVGAKALYYICPMHPAYKSDKPGVAPCCGMQVEPVFADGAGPPRVPGAIHVADHARQLIGVRVGEAEVRGAGTSLRTVGRVVPDENRDFRVLAAGEGVVRRLPVASASGGLVRENEVLMTYFAKDFVRPQQLFFATLDYLDAAVKGGAMPDRLAQVRGQVRVAIDELINFGMSEAQIAEIGRTRKLTSDIEVRSPASGLVVARGVSPGQRIERGTELFRIADIRRVWILVDVFETDGSGPRPGTRVRFTLPSAPSRAFEARVSDALPQFDPESRTMKIRLEADNPDLSLRPGMFVDAEVPSARPPGITVPVEAVVDTGRRRVVFVDRGNGWFEPRVVQTGWRSEDRVEIVRGLGPGERIVLSGTFLLDSETRMKAAAEGLVTPARDPVCGMNVDEGKAARAGRTSVHGGETYFFCAPGCKSEFDAKPEAFVAPAPAPAAAGAARPPGAAPRAGTLAPVPAGSVSDVLGPGEVEPVRTSITNVPVQMQLGQYATLAEAPTANVMMDAACGTIVLRADAERAGLTSVHAGTTYSFASARCKAQFDADPERYTLDPADEKRAVTAAYSASHAQESAAFGRGPAGAPAGAKGHADGAARPGAARPAPPTTVVDPVCRMEVDANEATHAGLRVVFDGSPKYFCSAACKEKFEQEPEAYVPPAGPAR